MAQYAIIRSVGGLVFDATLRESHSLSIEVSENPIETGSDVADHMFVKPVKFTLAAAVSDNPLHTPGYDPFAGQSRSQTAFLVLKSLMESGEPFDIQTGLILYTNMMCLDVRAEQDKDTDKILYFEADFKSVNIVSTQTVSYPPRKAGKTHRQASQTVQKGQQQGTQVTNDSGNQKQTLVLKFFNMITGK